VAILISREQNVAYIDRYLWLPKSAADIDVEQRFTQYADEGKHAEARPFYGETQHHWILPRYGISTPDLTDAGIPIVDLTHEISYRDVYFEDNVSSFLDDNQESAWDVYKDATSGVLCLGCGRGKTTLTCKKIAKEGKPALIILTSISQFTLWERDLLWTVGLRPEHIGRLHKNRCDWQGKPVVIGSADTIISRSNNYPVELFQEFGIVAFDECHHFSAWELSSVPSMFWGDRYGMTATPERSDGLEEAYKWLIGDIIHRDLIQPIRPIVEFVPTWVYIDPEDTAILDRYKRFNISKLNKALTTDHRRFRVLVSLVKELLNEGRKILVLTHVLDPIPLFSAAFPEAGVVTGKTDESTREDIIRASSVTIASFQVANEALNVIELDTVVFITPFKWEGLFRQGAGRALREHKGKKQPMVYVLEDTQPHAAGMCRSLRNVVAKEGHECRTRNVGYRLQLGRH